MQWSYCSLALSHRYIHIWMDPAVDGSADKLAECTLITYFKSRYTPCTTKSKIHFQEKTKTEDYLVHENDQQINGLFRFVVPGVKSLIVYKHSCLTLQLINSSKTNLSWLPLLNPAIVPDLQVIWKTPEYANRMWIITISGTAHIINSESWSIQIMVMCQ